MPTRNRPYVIGGRVNSGQLARVDAAARLEQVSRAEFIVRAAVEKAERTLKSAVTAEDVDGVPA